MTATSHPAPELDHEPASPAAEVEFESVTTGGARTHTRRSTVVVVLFAFTAGAATLAWERMFVNAGGLLICALAAMAAVVTSVTLRRAGVPLVVAPAASLVGLVLLGSISAVPVAGFGLPTPAALVTTIGWLPTMWNATLDLGIPTASRGQPLLLATAITWLLAAVGTELVIRSKARAAALACSVLIFGAALLLGSPLTTAPLWLTLPLIVTSLLFLVVSGGPGTVHRTGSDPTHQLPGASALSRVRGFLVRGGFGLIAVCGVALVLAGLLPWGEGEPPSLHRTPEFEPAQFTSPLSTVRPQMAADPPKRLFEVDVRSDDTVERISIAHLDNYNGDTWESRGDYRPINGFTGGEALAPDSSTVASGSVEVLDLDGPWLPALGLVTRIDLPDVQSDGASANFVLPSEVSGETTYTFDSRVITDRELIAAAAALAPPQPEHLQLPAEVVVDPDLEVGTTCRVSDVVAVAQEWTSGVSSSGGSGVEQLAKALAIENRLRSDFGLNTDRDAGHTLADLCRTLGVGPSEQDQPAHSEQFAATMALMLRGIGIPSRVVVGYELSPNDGGDSIVVTENDVTAWAEASIGAGWIPFDPTPGESKDDDSENTAVTEQRPAPPPTNPPVVDEPPATTTTTTPPGPTAPIDGDSSSGGVGVAAGGGGVILVVLALTVISVLKSRRRTRRRQAHRPGDAVLGAWLEALDMLRDRGFTPSAERTSNELADDATSFTRRPPLRSRLDQLASLADRALYSKAELPADQPEEAWNEFDSFESELNADTSKLQRFRARLRLRSLRRSTW